MICCCVGPVAPAREQANGQPFPPGAAGSDSLGGRSRGGALGQPQLGSPAPRLAQFSGQPVPQRRHQVVVSELIVLPPSRSPEATAGMTAAPVSALGLFLLPLVRFSLLVSLLVGSLTLSHGRLPRGRSA